MARFENGATMAMGAVALGLGTLWLADMRERDAWSQTPLGGSRATAKGQAAFQVWRGQVFRRMKKVYGLDPEDLPTDSARMRTAWNGDETPEAFCTWLGEKYDLTPIAEHLWPGERRRRGL